MAQRTLDPTGAPLPTLDVRLLGGFAVQVDGKALAPDGWPSLRRPTSSSC